MVKCPIPKCGKDYPLNIEDILPYPKTTCEHMSPDLIKEINRLKPFEKKNEEALIYICGRTEQIKCLNEEEINQTIEILEKKING